MFRIANIKEVQMEQDNINDNGTLTVARCSGLKFGGEKYKFNIRPF